MSHIQPLWAPWRLEYLQGEKESGCPFCELPKDGAQEKNLTLFVDSELFVLMNKFPYNPGHLLVIPRKHVSDPGELDASLWARLARGVQLSVEILKKAMAPQGFNMGMNIGASGGAGIPGHIHWHVVPRWSGDTNFMPLLAETKAIPTHNATVYRQLFPHFSGFAESLRTDKMKV